MADGLDGRLVGAAERITERAEAGLKAGGAQVAARLEEVMNRLGQSLETAFLPIAGLQEAVRSLSEAVDQLKTVQGETKAQQAAWLGELVLSREKLGEAVVELGKLPQEIAIAIEACDRCTERTRQAMEALADRLAQQAEAITAAAKDLHEQHLQRTQSSEAKWTELVSAVNSSALRHAESLRQVVRAQQAVAATLHDEARVQQIRLLLHELTGPVDHAAQAGGSDGKTA